MPVDSKNPCTSIPFGSIITITSVKFELPPRATPQFSTVLKNHYLNNKVSDGLGEPSPWKTELFSYPLHEMAAVGTVSIHRTDELKRADTSYTRLSWYLTGDLASASTLRAKLISPQIHLSLANFARGFRDSPAFSIRPKYQSKRAFFHVDSFG